ncbi:MAG: hypothetical protein AAGE94_22490 [Acidobacteriota bacterium]
MLHHQPRAYRLELGLNLRAAVLVGTRWRNRYFPLENALVDVTKPDRPQPAWFTHLRPGDRLSIRLVDISCLGEPSSRTTPTFPALVDLHFTTPDTGEATSPFVDPPRVWKLATEATPRWSPVYSRRREQRLATWDITGETPAGIPNPLVFAPVDGEFAAFQLSVVLRVDRDPFSDFFVFDPEMIIGDTGGGPIYDDEDRDDGGASSASNR